MGSQKVLVSSQESRQGDQIARIHNNKKIKEVLLTLLQASQQSLLLSTSGFVVNGRLELLHRYMSTHSHTFGVERSDGIEYLPHSMA